MTDRKVLYDDDGQPPMAPPFPPVKPFTNYWERPSPNNWQRRAAWCLHWAEKLGPYLKERLLEKWEYLGRWYSDEDFLTDIALTPYNPISDAQLKWLRRKEDRVYEACQLKFGPAPEASQQLPAPPPKTPEEDEEFRRWFEEWERERSTAK